MAHPAGGAPGPTYQARCASFYRVPELDVKLCLPQMALNKQGRARCTMAMRVWLSGLHDVAERAGLDPAPGVSPARPGPAQGAYQVP